VDHVYIVGARFQDVDDPSKLSSILSHDLKADEIGMVIGSLRKRWGSRSGNEQLAANQLFRLLNSLDTLQLHDPSGACPANPLYDVLGKIVSGPFEEHGCRPCCNRDRVGVGMYF
jgi:hypothetical protein